MANPSAVVVISRFLSGMYTEEDLNIFVNETNSVLVKLFLGIIEFYRNSELLGISDAQINTEFAVAFPTIEQSHVEFVNNLVMGWFDGTVPEDLYNIAMTGAVGNSTEIKNFALLEQECAGICDA